jgi:hypothetical protein
LQLDVSLNMVCSPDFLKTAGSKDKKEEGDDPKGIWQIHEALVNYATLMHVLWPYHYAWLNIWRLLVEVRFGELVSADERDRAALVTRFFNAVTKENSGRATRKQEPLSFDDVKKKWERIVSASFPRVAAKPAAAPQNNNRGQSGAGRGAGPGRGGLQRGRVATPRASFKGGPVCFAYNQVGGCGRPTAPGGCVDNGATPPRLYHHVCNFLTRATNNFCLKQHPRHSNH